MLITAGFCFVVLLTVASLYVFVAHLYYCFRKYGCHRCDALPSKMSTMTTVVSGTVFMYGVLESVERYLAQYPDDIPRNVFDVLFSLTSILYAASLITVYAILWLRQRCLYNKPALAHLTSTYTRIASKYLIIVIVVLGIAILVSTVTANWLQICRGRCLEVLTFCTILGAPVLVQILLLALFLFPLFKHQSSNQSVSVNYVPLMKRIAILTTVCLVTDIATTLLAVFLLEPAFLGINLVTNLLCVIFSTSDWKNRLWPCTSPLNDARSYTDTERSSEEL